MKRIFRDAPPWARCAARITLGDGSHAQCGRWQNEGYRKNPCVPNAVCTQHGNMLFDGKTVIRFFDGAEMKLIDRLR